MRLIADAISTDVFRISWIWSNSRLVEAGTASVHVVAPKEGFNAGQQAITSPPQVHHMLHDRRPNFDMKHERVNHL